MWKMKFPLNSWIHNSLFPDILSSVGLIATMSYTQSTALVCDAPSGETLIFPGSTACWGVCICACGLCCLVSWKGLMSGSTLTPHWFLPTTAFNNPKAGQAIALLLLSLPREHLSELYTLEFLSAALW